MLPSVRGTVFVAGIGQATAISPSIRRGCRTGTRTRISGATSADTRATGRRSSTETSAHYAVAGATPETRRDSLNEYLQHQVSLAGVAPASGRRGASVPRPRTYSPLANAAWQYDASFGWTNVTGRADAGLRLGADVRDALGGEQPLRLRVVAAEPRRLPAADFNAQTDALLVRLAAAIADSAEVAGARPAELDLVHRTLDGAAATTAWRTFAAWKPSVARVHDARADPVARVPSAPMTVELRTSSGTSYTAGLPVPVELSSSSPTGELSTTSSGPWTATLATSIASGQSTTSFYFRDTQSGSATITAAAAGKTAATQAITVAAPPAETPPAPAGPRAGTSPPPTTVEPAGGTPTVVTPVAPPATARPAPPPPTLRVVGAMPTRVTRRGWTGGHVDPLLARCSCAAPRPRDTASLHSRDRIPSRNHLGGAPLTTGRDTATATALHDGTYALLARLRAAQLIRGRSYLVRLTAVDTGRRQRR